MRGELVKPAGGAIVGQISRILISVDDGHIAYILLSRGGISGVGEEWVPVPAQALTWSSRDDAYMLKTPTGAQPPPSIQNGADPVEVRSDQLRALFAYYGVMPFWQH